MTVRGFKAGVAEDIAQFFRDQHGSSPTASKNAYTELLRDVLKNPEKLLNIKWARPTEIAVELNTKDFSANTTPEENAALKELVLATGLTQSVFATNLIASSLRINLIQIHSDNWTMYELNSNQRQKIQELSPSQPQTKQAVDPAPTTPQPNSPLIQVVNFGDASNVERVIENARKWTPAAEAGSAAERLKQQRITEMVPGWKK